MIFDACCGSTNLSIVQINMTRKTMTRRTSSATPMRLRLLSEFIFEMLKANLRDYEVIDAEPARAGEKKPEKDHETEHLRKIEKFGEPAERRCRFDISNRGGRNCYNHQAAEHHARNGRHCAEDE